MTKNTQLEAICEIWLLLDAARQLRETVPYSETNEVALARFDEAYRELLKKLMPGALDRISRSAATRAAIAKRRIRAAATGETVVPGRPRKATDDMIERARAMHLEEGASLRQIATALVVSRTTVMRMLRGW